jgi:energy-coupling factor transporter ATP-binding protein EcfA2
VDGASEPGFAGPAAAAHIYLSRVACDVVLGSLGAPGAQEEADDKLEQMNQLLQALLGTRLVYGAMDKRTRLVPILLFDRPFDWKELSQGQRILLTWAIQLHAQRAKLDRAVLFLDEPEVHLHPAAVVDALRRLVKLVGEGTVFVATHSLSIVAWATPARCWYLERGQLHYGGGSAFGSMIAGLVGDEDSVAGLFDLLSERSIVALYKFAADCFLPAGVADFEDGDLQQHRFVAAATEKESGGAVDILEYGAGKGRLGRALAEAGLSTRVRYSVVNDERWTSAEVEGACRSVLVQLGDGAGAYLRSLRDLATGYDGAFDVVVLCNVLHEIPCDKWPELFQTFHAILRPTGCVLLMEDQEMKIGELPTTIGFLTLDQIEVAALFGVRAADIERRSDGRDARLTIFAVPREHLNKASRVTVAAAVERVIRRAEEKLLDLRKQAPRSPSFADGRAHAFFAMLLSNAHLARRALGVEMKV